MNPSHSIDPTLNSNQFTGLPLTNNHPDTSQNLPTATGTPESEPNTLHRCEMMEKGLNEIRTALGALKMTCATLEMHADRLGSEIAALKVVATPPPSTPMDTQGEMSLHTPPTTPARQIRCLPREEDHDSYLFSHMDFHRSPTMSRPSKGILGKRRSPPTDPDQNNQTQTPPDSRENPKPHKRVRFADIEDIPTSHVRTPIHRLKSRAESDELVLPTPNGALRRTGNTTINIPPSATILQTPIPCSPSAKGHPPMKFHDFNFPIRPLPARARQKTRWDPTTGKRIPITTLPNHTVPADTPISEPHQDDYERRLSDGLSNASLG